MNNVRNKEYLIALGKHIRQLRLEKGLSQAELSYSSDVAFNQIGRIERGEVNVTASTLYAIAITFELHPSVLLQFEFPVLSESKKKTSSTQKYRNSGTK